MRRTLLLGILLCPLVAHAEFFVCGDATKFDQAFYRDQSQDRPANCSQVPDDQAQQQYDLINQLTVPPVPLYYLKVIPPAPNGLAVEMTPEEKQAVDAARQAQQETQQGYNDELTGNAFCNEAQLAAITEKLVQRRQLFRDKMTIRHDTLAGQINAIATINLTTMKQMGNGLNDELYNMAMFNVVDELFDISEKLTRCIRAIVQTR